MSANLLGHTEHAKMWKKERALECAIYLAVFLSTFAKSSPVWAFDPLRTGELATPTASGAMLNSEGRAEICVFGPLPSPLPLQDAVERTLCNNPKTREAWAQVKLQAAGVGIGRSAYLPNVTATWQGERDDTVTNVNGFPQYSSDYRNLLKTDSVSLSWVLYDFGSRAAALKNASALLEAARASQEAALETAFADVAKDYYAAQAAQGAFVSDKEIELTAENSYKAAVVRVDKGIAPISDELQARTSWAQAVVDRTKAEGTWQSALGTLASDMDLIPSTPLILPDVSDGVKPDNEFTDSVDDLIDIAKRSHPSVVAAEEQVEAAAAKVDQTRSDGLPKLSLVAKYSQNNQPTTLAVGIPQFPATGHEWYLGVELTIPIFEGFGRTYQIQQAQAQTELERDTLDEVQQKVGLDVWTSYQTLQASTSNLENSSTLLDVAGQSYTAAQHRYQGGVGNILELLSAQAALAAAKRQRVQALTDWRSARLQLAASLGKLGMWNVLGDHPPG